MNRKEAWVQLQQDCCWQWRHTERRGSCESESERGITPTSLSASGDFQPSWWDSPRSAPAAWLRVGVTELRRCGITHAAYCARSQQRDRARSRGPGNKEHVVPWRAHPHSLRIPEGLQNVGPRTQEQHLMVHLINSINCMTNHKIQRDSK